MSASERHRAAGGGAGSASSRLVRAWQGLPSERRLAAGASLALFLSLFLPWYQETVIASGVNSLRSVSESLTGWAAFSFVEAAVLLVAASVVALLFARAEGRAFHVPGGDGGVITGAGLWTCVLIIWRIFDKEGTSGHGQVAFTSGIDWGIFVALAVAGVLTYAGTRIRHAHEPEPPLPGDPAPARSEAVPAQSEAAVAWTAPPGSEVPRRVRPRSLAEPPERPRDGPGQQPPRAAPLDRQSIDDLDIADPPTSPLARSEPSTVRLFGSEAPTRRIRRDEES